MNSGVGHRCGLDPVLLWLWRRPAAAALIQPLAWELRGSPKKTKKKKKKKSEKKIMNLKNRLVVAKRKGMEWDGFGIWG